MKIEQSVLIDVVDGSDMKFELIDVIDGYLCPVCGFHLSVAPADFAICPSCGTEFGNDDLDWSYEELRAQWLSNGPQWWSKSHKAPTGWDPLNQVLAVTPIEGSWNIENTPSTPVDDLVPFEAEGTSVKGYWRLTAVAA